MKTIRIKQILIPIIVLCITYGSGAQELDTKKMDRDLEVSKNILQTLLNSDENVLFWGTSIDANYLEGYGVIFTIPNNMRYFVSSTSRSWGRAKSRSKIAYSYAIADGSSEGIVIAELNQDSLAEVDFEQKKQAITTFFSDYADLIGQLKPDERIKVQSKGNDYDLVYVGFSEVTDVENRSNGFVAEVLRKDITQYRTGKITASEFEKSIRFERSKPKEKIQDLELFASILKRLYSPDLSETFFTERTPRYERIDNYGAIFYMKTYSSYANKDLYDMPVLSRSDIDSEERKQTIVKLYPKFESDMKKVMLDYGRTISSLKSDEVLSMDIKLTRCEDCDIPKSIVLTSPMDVIAQYGQQKISMESALKKIKVRKVMN